MPTRGTGSIFWNGGPWTAGMSVNYQSEFQPYAGASSLYPTYVEWNPQVGYDFGRSDLTNGSDHWWATALRDSKISLTIVNLFNNDPDYADVGTGRVVMDARLRRYIITVTKKF